MYVCVRISLILHVWQKTKGITGERGREEEKRGGKEGNITLAEERGKKKMEGEIEVENEKNWIEKT